MKKSDLAARGALAVVCLLGAVLVYVGVKLDRTARIGAGYKAKIVCSEMFVAGRADADVLATEFSDIDPFMERLKVKIDVRKRETRASAPLGLGRARAIYRQGYGCTLANGGRLRPAPAAAPEIAADPWPVANAARRGARARINFAEIEALLDDAFAADDGHRAVLIAVDGEIVAERYADGFTKATRFASWSMAKSVTSTLVGAAVLEGVVDIEQPAPFAEWQADPVRSQITWRDLLQMQSGLHFNEDYANPRADVTRMLFESADASAIASNRNASAPPGTVWQYSSGTTNLISKALREGLTGAGKNYHHFPDEAVFEPIGATSFVLEPDASGNFIGSSFIYATARDWARLGQLYVQDGIWDGVRLLPDDWTDFVTEPASASNGQYGGHFWLNRDGADGAARFVPGAPETAYYMSGRDGQFVFIVPSKNMIIVRTGLNRNPPAGKIVSDLFSDLVQAVSDA